MLRNLIDRPLSLFLLIEPCMVPIVWLYCECPHRTKMRNAIGGTSPLQSHSIHIWEGWWSNPAMLRGQWHWYQSVLFSLPRVRGHDDQGAAQSPMRIHFSHIVLSFDKHNTVSKKAWNDPYAASLLVVSLIAMPEIMQGGFLMPVCFLPENKIPANAYRDLGGRGDIWLCTNSAAGAVWWKHSTTKQTKKTSSTRFSTVVNKSQAKP